MVRQHFLTFDARQRLPRFGLEYIHYPEREESGQLEEVPLPPELAWSRFRVLPASISASCLRPRIPPSLLTTPLNCPMDLLPRGASSVFPAFAGIAQLVEQLICNQQVIGSSPIAGSLFRMLSSK